MILGNVPDLKKKVRLSGNKHVNLVEFLNNA